MNNQKTVDRTFSSDLDKQVLSSSEENCNNSPKIFDVTGSLTLELDQDVCDSFSFALMREIERVFKICTTSCRPIDEDMTQNKNFILCTESGDYFAKVYVSGSINDRIFEARVLKELSLNNMFITKTITEEPLLINDAPVMLFEVIKGHTFYYQQLTTRELFTIATQIAQMHNALRFFNPGEKTKFNALGFEFISKFELNMTDPIIVECFEFLKPIFEDVDMNELISTIIHDDLSPHNIMRTKDGTMHFIDFDDAHRSYRISDIGTAIKEFIIHPIKRIDDEAIANFIRNYESVNGTPRLTEQEKQLIIPMVLRRALFMYAYYKQVEREKHLSLQSKDEYDVIVAILASRRLVK